MFTKSFWDRIGIGLSGICIIHCLVVPIFISLLPLYPAAEVMHTWTHPVLLILIIPTIYFSIKHRGAPMPAVVLMLSGLAILIVTWGLHGWLGQKGESWITLMGSMLLVAGHYLNYKNHSARLCSVADAS